MNEQQSWIATLSDDTATALGRLADAFRQRRHRLVLVGGSVRDRLLGRSPGDLDLATDAPPAVIRDCARQAGAEAIYAVGHRFGTIAILFPNLKVEVSPFKSLHVDESDGTPQAILGASLEDDLAHRDFTINAMAVDTVSGEVIDLHGGQGDLSAGIIRAVGSADERFAEDPLRPLRAVRLAAELGFRIEAATSEAIARHAAGLGRASSERIAAELAKLLLSERPGAGLDLLSELGLMSHIIPEVDRLQHLRSPDRRHKDVYRHTVQVVDQAPPDLVVRLAALLHDIAKPDTILVKDGEVHFPHHEVVGAEMSRAILRRLRFDRRVVESVVRLVLLHQRINQYEDDWSDAAVRRLMRDVDGDLEKLFALCRADVTSRRPQKVREARARLNAFIARSNELAERDRRQPPESPLDGHDLMALFGRPPGPWVGQVKNYLLSLVLEGQLAPDDKERAEQLAREYVATHLAD